MPRLRPLQLSESRSVGISVVDQVELFARWHILDIRRNKRGELTRVKHATEGWLELEDYVDRQHQHELAIATIPQIVNGGYRMKQALWTSKLEIAGFSLPIGASIPAVGTGWAVLDSAKAADPNNPNRIQDGLTAIRDVADLVLPFGDVDLMIRMANAAIGIVPSPIQSVLQKDPWLALFGLFGVAGALFNPASGQLPPIIPPINWGWFFPWLNR